jgi:hypothetical protein
MIYIAYYFIFSAIVSLVLGAAIKNKRCADLGISHEEDQRLQDEAQMYYLRTGKCLNVIDGEQV